MTKVTSKLQVTIPKAIAQEYAIAPGDEIEFRPAGSQIRVIPPQGEGKRLSQAERLRLFDDARVRQRRRERGKATPTRSATERGWAREDLYTRGEPLKGESGNSSSVDEESD